MKIDELNLSVRTYNALLRAGITEVDKLEKMSDTELGTIRNLSGRCVMEIKQAIRRANDGKID